MRGAGMRAWLAIVMFLLVACGRGGGSSSSGPTAAAVPTMPSASFAQPTTMIQSPGAVTASEAITDSSTVTMTEAVTATEAVSESAATETPTPAPASPAEVDFTRGMNSYANRGCAECHGAQGEGVDSKGAALAGTALSEVEFSDAVRTGGKGALGPAHIYGPGAISPGALASMYAWLSSLDE